jgi:hypothetical protein
VGDAVTSIIELAVGLVSLLAGVGAWRSSRFRWLAPILLLAGVAACVHAVADLVG